MPVETMRHNHASALQIDLLHLALEERYIVQELSDGVNNIREIQVTGGDFVQHWSEQEEVFLVDERDLKLGSSRKSLIQFQRRIQSAKPPPTITILCFWFI